MRVAIALTVSVVSLTAALALGGCGSSSGPNSSTTAAVAAAARKNAALARAAANRAPKGSSHVLREIYRQFGPPKPDPAVKGSARAIEAGKRACAGKTPVEVKEEFFAAAKHNLSPEQGKIIARIKSFAARASRDGSFAAGQLAADVYEATLPQSIAAYGYQGCVYSLARVLEHQLAPR